MLKMTPCHARKCSNIRIVFYNFVELTKNDNILRAIIDLYNLC